MTEDIANTSILITKVCCGRVQCINQLRYQAINLGLSESYITTLNDWLTSVVPMQSLNEVTEAYDYAIDSILEQRDAAMLTFIETLKQAVTIYPKTPPVEEPIETPE